MIVSVGMSPRGAGGAAVLYAGFWRRLFAFLIDMTLLWAVQATIATAMLATQPPDLRTLANLAAVSSLLAWAYFALMESSPLRATLGKLALGIWVGDVHGDQISFTRASFRYWFKSLSSLTFVLGYLMAAFTPHKQALHDVLARTLVLRTAAVPEPALIEELAAVERWDGTRWVTSAPQTEAR